MRRRRAVLLLVVLALAVGVAWWVGRGPDVDLGGAIHDVPSPQDAPPEEAPALSAPPPRPVVARAAAAASEAAGDPAADAPPMPGGALTIRIELPSPPDPALEPLPLFLRLVSGDGDVIDRSPDAPAAPKPEGEPVTESLPVEGEPVVESLRPLDFRAREPVPAWKVLGLLAGEWMAYAFPAAFAKDEPRRTWGPVLVRLAAAPVEVTLPLATDATHGTLRMKAVRGESFVPATFDVSWRGRRLGRFAVTDPTSEGEVRVPADEDVSVTATTPDSRAAPAPPRTVRVAAGAVEEVRFEFPALVPVTLTVLRPGRVPAPASVTIWRDPDGRVPSKAVQVEHDPRQVKEDGALATELSPGDYGVLVARVAPHLPVWRPFRVEPDAPMTVEILLDHTGPEATCLVQRADGAPADGYGLWLGRLDGSSPAQTATAMATSGPDGRISFGPLPDGEYLVADYGHSVWRTLSVASGLVEPAILRLPAPAEGTAGAVLQGRVRAPSGEPVRQGLVCVGRADGWRRYAHFSNGRFELKAPAGEGVLTVHHTWFEPDLFAPWSRAVVVEAGKDQTFDVRLRPR